MPSETRNASIAVFDLGGTWFRWGCYEVARGLVNFQRAPAVSYLSHPHLSAQELQGALTDFVVRRTRELRDAGHPDLSTGSVSIGAAVNAHDMIVLGSGPLWGPAAKPFQLGTCLREVLPELQWHVINDVTALLAPYMTDCPPRGKTLLLTVSTGIGSRVYDHRAARIPYDAKYGVQGEIGHLTVTFELDGKVLNRKCECGGSNHVNAFSSGRGIAKILESLPSLSANYAAIFSDPPRRWLEASDGYRLSAFNTQLDLGCMGAIELLESFVTPVSRMLAAALSLDPDIDRIVMTGGVAHGFGRHYREALSRVFTREGLYQITPHDPHYLARRLHWEDAGDFGGLRGAGIYAQMLRTRAEADKELNND